MYLRKVVMLNLFVSLTMSQEQLGSDIDGEAAEDISGYNVSLDSDGDRVAIGALQNDGNGSDAGHTRIYSWDGSSWSQLGSDIDGEPADDRFGRSVSLNSDGDQVAIGAFFMMVTDRTQVMYGSIPGMEAAGVSLALTLTAKLQATILVILCP